MDYQTYIDSDFQHRNIALDDAYVREVVGLFTSAEDLQKAIRELEGRAFPRQDISVMGSRGELEKVFGSKTVAPEAAMDNAYTPRRAPARSEELTIGAAALIGVPAYVGAMTLALTAGAITFPAIVSAAVIGGMGGGTLGAILTKIMGDRYDRHVKEQVERGGLLLWVRTPTSTLEETAKHIMIACGGYKVHAHEIP